MANLLGQFVDGISQMRHVSGGEVMLDASSLLDFQRGHTQPNSRNWIHQSGTHSYAVFGVFVDKHRRLDIGQKRDGFSKW